LAPHGSTLVAVMPDGIMWRYKDFADYTYDAASPIVTPSDVLNTVGNQRGPAFLFVTTGQIQYGITSYGLPSDWGAAMARSLAASPDFKLIYANPDARIYAVHAAAVPAAVAACLSNDISTRGQVPDQAACGYSPLTPGPSVSITGEPGTGVQRSYLLSRLSALMDEVSGK
jgi:hypothetical protein